MGELIIESYGKINLTLDILHKRKDGYHEINSVMQRIDLKDTLAFKEIDKGIIIESNNPQVPKDSTNLVYKAWEKLKQISGIDRGIHVKIDKRIPVAAGLAGGSSNGAATLQAINQLWNLKLSDIELMKIGKDLGADIPFCIMGGTALAQGIGEKLIKLKPFTGKHILLCNPGIEISTAYAYSKVQLGEERLDVDKLISCIEREDLHCVAKNLGNKMETLIIQEYPIIDKIKSTMIESGALGALMSGSGPTVFGIYDDEEKLLFTKDKLKDISKIIIPCKTI